MRGSGTGAQLGCIHKQEKQQAGNAGAESVTESEPESGMGTAAAAAVGDTSLAASAVGDNASAPVTVLQGTVPEQEQQQTEMAAEDTAAATAAAGSSRAVAHCPVQARLSG